MIFTHINIFITLIALDMFRELLFLFCSMFHQQFHVCLVRVYICRFQSPLNAHVWTTCTQKSHGGSSHKAVCHLHPLI